MSFGIEETFQDIPGLKTVSDDILIFSTTMEEHNAILRKIFDRAGNYGVQSGKKQFSNG